MGKKAFLFLPAVLLAAFIALILVPLSGHAFWYGEQTLDAMGYSYSTCDSLASINRSLQRDMRGFDNGSGGGQGVTIDEPGSWDGYTLLSCVGGCRHDDAPDPSFYYPSLLVGPEGEFVHAWDDINNIPGKLITLPQTVSDFFPINLIISYEIPAMGIVRTILNKIAMMCFSTARRCI